MESEDVAGPFVQTQRPLSSSAPMFLAGLRSTAWLVAAACTRTNSQTSVVPVRRGHSSYRRPFDRGNRDPSPRSSPSALMRSIPSPRTWWPWRLPTFRTPARSVQQARAAYCTIVSPPRSCVKRRRCRWPFWCPCWAREHQHDGSVPVHDIRARKHAMKDFETLPPAPRPPNG